MNASAPRPRLVVLGSVNVDLVVTGVPLPRPGQTVVGGTFATHQGGKGGNQAVAAARALRGGPHEGAVAFVGAVGADGNGRQALEALDIEGIEDEAVSVLVEAATGVALIVVGPRGENQIAVAPGANARLDPALTARAVRRLLAGGGVFLASLEVPEPVVAAAARGAREMGAMIVVNPAPAHGASGRLIELADVLTPNETELAGLERRGLLQRVRPELRLVVTLGPEGALVRDGDGERLLPALATAAIDTTGAGDAFNGVLAAALFEGRPFREAVRRAIVGAGLSVTMPGAREGMPLRAAIDARVADEA